MMLYLMVPLLVTILGRQPIAGGPVDPARAARPVRLAADTVPQSGGYTGLTVGYRRTARYVGQLVVDTGAVQVMVFSVASGSPAFSAGLAERDVIVELDGVALTSTTPLERLAPGVSYALRVLRGADEVEVTLVPGPPRQPAPSQARPSSPPG